MIARLKTAVFQPPLFFADFFLFLFPLSGRIFFLPLFSFMIPKSATLSALQTRDLPVLQKNNTRAERIKEAPLKSRLIKSAPLIKSSKCFAFPQTAALRSYFFSALFSSDPHKKQKKRIEISTRLGKLDEKAYLLARAVDALHQHAFNVGCL